MGEEDAPKYDDETGVPLNDAARRVVEAATRHPSAPAADGASAPSSLDGVPEVVIAEGKWKYVQIRLYPLDAEDGEYHKRVVRNASGLSYHADMYSDAMYKLESEGVRVSGKVVGGGRIVLDSKAKRVSVYGYSKTFGHNPSKRDADGRTVFKGCNETTAEIIRRNYPGFTVDWSDDGY